VNWIRRAQRILQGREEEAEGKDQEPTEVEPLVTLSHRGAAGDVEFDPAEESLGTMVWLGLSGPILDAIAHGDVLLVDEIEASLHPALVTQLVKLFQSPESNPKGAQIIFNSHEASLLGDSRGDRVLGRDQVWFTEKDHDGGTRLFPLADLSPRPDEAIERRYRAGRYGATPILATEEFAQAALNAAGQRR
jgi:predicted ATPase